MADKGHICTFGNNARLIYLVIVIITVFVIYMKTMTLEKCNSLVYMWVTCELIKLVLSIPYLLISKHQIRNQIEEIHRAQTALIKSTIGSKAIRERSEKGGTDI